MDIDGGSDWAPLNKIDFTEGDGPQGIWVFSEMGRQIALHSADALDSALYDLYETLLASSWLGGRTAEGRAKAKRLLRPLRRTANNSLPAAARRFAMLPDRFKSVYDQELHPRRSGTRGGIPNPNARH